MIDKPQLKDAVILQQAWQIGPFADMLRLTYQRHAAYAWAHGMEYIAWAGSLKPDMWPGGWGKIWLMRLMLDQGYKYVFWIDTDAAIVDLERIVEPEKAEKEGFVYRGLGKGVLTR